MHDEHILSGFVCCTAVSAAAVTIYNTGTWASTGPCCFAASPSHVSHRVVAGLAGNMQRSFAAMEAAGGHLTTVLTVQASSAALRGPLVDMIPGAMYNVPPDGCPALNDAATQLQLFLQDPALSQQLLCLIVQGKCLTGRLFRCQSAAAVVADGGPDLGPTQPAQLPLPYITSIQLS